MDFKDVPTGKNQAAEHNTNGARNKTGVYTHKDSGAKQIALSVPAADAFVQAGFEYEGPVPANTLAAKPAVDASDAEKEELKKQLADAQAAQKAAEAAAKQAQADAKKAADAAKPAVDAKNNTGEGAK